MSVNTTFNLVLDLDGTLIDTFQPEIPQQADEYFNIFKKEKNFLMMVKELAFVGFVFLRPGLVEFLQQAQKIFNLYIFSAGGDNYVRTIVKAIRSKMPSINIKGVWTRDNLINNFKCIHNYLNVYNTYIIDDIPSYWRQKCFRIDTFKSFNETIKIDETTNKKTNVLKKVFNDDDKYLNNFLTKILKLVHLEHFNTLPGIEES